MRYVLTLPIHALVIGRCASSATFPLLACKVRRCTPHATFLVHSAKLDAPVVVHDIDRAVADAKKSLEVVIDLYVRELQKTRAEIVAMMERGDRRFDCDYTAEQALEIGLITEIVRDHAGLLPIPNPT